MSTGRPKIFDCFMFFEEEEILRGRIALLRDCVDIFVIVEAGVTHAGSPRDYLFPEIRDSLGLEEHRVVHVRIDEFPTTDDPWAREGFQRDAILIGLRKVGAAGDDLIVVSDVDEIPRPEVLETLRHTLREPVTLGMSWNHYSVNRVAPDTVWQFAKACRMASLTGPSKLRWTKDLPIIDDAGWHLSYVGDQAAVVRKLTSFAHTEHSGPVWTSPRHVERCLRLGVRISGGLVFEVVPDDRCIPSLPRDEYPHLYAPQPGPINRLRAWIYAFVSSYRHRMPLWLADRFPELALAAAGPLHLRNVWAHAQRRRYAARVGASEARNP